MKNPKNLADLPSYQLSKIALEIVLIMMERGGMALDTFEDVESFGVEIRIGKNVANNNGKE